MKTKTKKYLSALAVYCGTIIGVGLFALPYVASKAGFITVLLFLIFLSFYSVVITLVYGEMIERTKGLHRLPGYAGIYLGKKFKIASSFSGIIGISLSLLAYIVVGGGFLHELLGNILGGEKFLYMILFYLVGAIAIYFTAKTIAKIEVLMLIFFLLVIALLFIKGIPHFQATNFLTFDKKYLFLPYGVVLFSVAGITIIPEVKDVLGKGHQKLLKPVLISGTILVFITYLIFTISVLGITGSQTTQDALGGIKNIYNSATFIFLIFGILTTFTSFITLGSTLKKIYWYDLKIHHSISWALAMCGPFILYILGLRNFIIIMGVTGAIVGAFDTIIMNLCYLRSRKKGNKKPGYTLGLHKNIIYTIIALFLVGIVLELLTINNY